MVSAGGGPDTVRHCAWPITVATRVYRETRLAAVYAAPVVLYMIKDNEVNPSWKVFVSQNPESLRTSPHGFYLCSGWAHRHVSEHNRETSYCARRLCIQSYTLIFLLPVLWFS
jgi:hypothetical protein